MHHDTEQIIEELKAEFKTVDFVAGTVGFVMRKGAWQYALPYLIFDDPNWRVLIINAVTLLETAPQVINNIPGPEHF